ncbi:Endoribonuclease L-PSP/chorismate mutase-like protein, partial [Triangularia verruculosa]
MARPFAIYTDNAPAPAPELSQAVQINDMIFCSGTMAIDPETGHLIENTFKKRVERCLINLESILIAAECDFKNVVKVNVFSTDMRNLDELDESYNEFVNRFDMDGDPARTCVAVHQLPWGTDVMIDCIA